MSVDNSGLFELHNIASFGHGYTIKSSAFTESKNYIYGLVLNENKKIHTCSFSKHRKEEKHKECDPNKTSVDDFVLKELDWFSNESLKAKSVAFNPLGDYSLVVTENFDLYVISISKILPDNQVFGKSSSGLSWDKDPVTQVFRGPREITYGSPTVVHWWETSDFIQLGIIGTDTGYIVLVNLITGAILGSNVVSSEILHLDVVMDPAMDCVHLLISGKDTQWRLLVEQRSTGYVWGSGDCEVVGRESRGMAMEQEDQGVMQRSRLQGLKQMSVDKIANIRQRLAEGRRMLRTRSESDELGNSLMTKPECLTNQVGNTRIAVQKDTGRDRQFLSGIFCESSMLTLHNTELEVIPQSVYKLPPNVDRVIVNGKLIFLSTSQTTNANPQVSVCSSVLAETKVNDQNFKKDSVLQSFDLQSNEEILLFSCVHYFQSEETESSDPPSQKTEASKGPFRRLVCVTKDQNGDIQKTIVEPTTSIPSEFAEIKTKDMTEVNSSQTTEFERKTKSQVDLIKHKYSDSYGAYIVVTNLNIYLLKMTLNPVDMFLGYAMQGQMKESETISKSFGLEKNYLLELAGDMRLFESDFSSAVTLYRQAGAKHLKTALKLASNGNVPELLSFLQAIFNTQNLEVSQTEKIHLSNLAMMCYFQQNLVKTFLSRDHFEEKILSFMRQNKWYDQTLAVNQAVETGQWKILNALTQHSGLDFEVGESLVAYMDKMTSQSASKLDEIVRNMASEEKHNMFSTFLLPNLIVSLATNPGAGKSLTKILCHLLPSMNSGQLNSVLHMSCPARRDLQPILCTPPTGLIEMKQFAKSILELFTLTCLVLLKRKAEAGSETGFNKSIVEFLMKSSREFETKHDAVVAENILSCGFNHTLFRSSGDGEVTTWGAASEGRLGQGRGNNMTSPPGHLQLFNNISIKVIQVACGKLHSLALTDAGLYSWGSNQFGQLGVGKFPRQTNRPCLVPCLDNVVQVSCGQFHSLSVDSAGVVSSWGWGVHGQSGHGGVEDVHTPRVVDGLKRYKVVQVGAGYAHSLALTHRGEVFVWGSGLFGQMGNGENKKCSWPVKVELPGPAKMISTGYFHNIALMQSEAVMVWGSNPQILRLEAQQRKKEKILQKQLQEKKKLEQLENEKNSWKNEFENETMKEITNEDSVLSIDPEKAVDSLVIPPPEEETNTEMHLSPTLLDISQIDGQINSVSCGSQHTAILTTNGSLYTFGRNLEGQLGLGSRTSIDVPTEVTALRQECVCQVATGADFTTAITDSGTVFGWGSNAAGQLGKAPVEADGGTDSSKVLVMKTTKRIIRLQHGLKNSCDIPKPVQGLSKAGIYSEECPDSVRNERASEFYSTYRKHKLFPPLEPVFHTKLLQTFLHLTVEIFGDNIDMQKLLRKCLVHENPQAAAKISLVERKVMQAYDLTLQAIIKHNKNVPENIFQSFQYYATFKFTSKEEKSQLFERLVACWQDQRYSFVKLENLILNLAEENILHILIFTLFCPITELEDGPDGPGKRNSLTDPRLVDLFSPEFCLKIGDKFIQSVKSTEVEKSSEDQLESVKNIENGVNFEIQLRNIVTEMMEKELT